MGYSGTEEIALLFGICMLGAGLALDSAAWYIQYPLVLLAVGFSLIGFRLAWQSSSS